MKPHILVVDDDLTITENISLLLKRRDFLVSTANSAESALAQIKNIHFDLVLTDLIMPGMNGIDLLNNIKSIYPDTMVIMITAYGSIKTSVSAMKNGAFDYLVKPCDKEELLLKINRALRYRKEKFQYQLLLNKVEQKYEFRNIIGQSESMQKIFKLIEALSEVDSNVLILGETGTGKELTAKAIHFHSSRKENPFITVNCSALTETLLESELFGHVKGAFTGADKQKIGKFEQANTGTIFLDEVGDIPLTTQVKLLRVLEQKEIERVGDTNTIKLDIRILAATNRDLKTLITRGRFREDLYYRLNVVNINLPPLRERIEDIPILAERFLKSANKKFKKNIKGFDQQVEESLLKYNWPGNIRELKNIIERAVILEKGPIISTHNIKISEQDSIISPDPDLSINYQVFETEYLDPIKKKYFLKLLKICQGNASLVADRIQVNRKTLYRWLKQLGIRLK